MTIYESMHMVMGDVTYMLLRICSGGVVAGAVQDPCHVDNSVENSLLKMDYQNVEMWITGTPDIAQRAHFIPPLSCTSMV